MISWIVIMLLWSLYVSLYYNYVNDFLNSHNAFIMTLPKAIPTRPGGQNIVRYFNSPQIINDKVLFEVHIYLIRSINILTSLMISCIVLMLWFLHYQKLSLLDQWVKILYVFFTPPPPPLLIINDKVLLVFHIYLRRYIIISTSYQWFSWVFMDAFIMYYQHMISQSCK